MKTWSGFDFLGNIKQCNIGDKCFLLQLLQNDDIDQPICWFLTRGFLFDQKKKNTGLSSWKSGKILFQYFVILAEC